MVDKNKRTTKDVFEVTTNSETLNKLVGTHVVKKNLFVELEALLENGTYSQINFGGSEISDRLNYFKYQNLIEIIRETPKDETFNISLKRSDNKNVETINVRIVQKRQSKKSDENDSHIFTVARLNSEDSNLVRGTYTNKKMLFDALEISINSHGYDEVSFVDIFTYEDKKFNYSNLTAVIRTLVDGEFLSLKLTKTQTEESIIIQISIRNRNTPNLKLS